MAPTGSEMTEQADNRPTTKPARGIPTRVQLKLKSAIRALLEEHGSRRFRHHLREDPEFSPWVGYDVGRGGETGDKRLDRLVAEVKKEIAAAKRRGRLGAAPATAVAVRPIGQREGSTTPAQVLGGSPSAALGHEEIERLASRCLPELDAAMAACHDETGLVDIDGYVKLARERRATLMTLADLSQRFQSQRNSNAFLTAIWDRIAQEFRDEPERGRTFFADMNTIAAALSGLPLTGGGSLETPK